MYDVLVPDRISVLCPRAAPPPAHLTVRDATKPAVDQDTIQLVKDLQAGDAHAFERFVEIYRPRLFSFSYGMCGQREDAEDVAQETLLQAFRKLNTLRAPEALNTWLFRIARNACLLKHRKSKFAPEHEISLDDHMPGRDGEGVPDIPDWSRLPDQELLNAEVGEQLRRAIARLAPKYRMVLLLRDVQQLSTAEVAKIVGISEDAVKTQLHRARLAVRSELTQYLRPRVAADQTVSR
jgi:RNA polymerase sigma-70 factor, ECF subfamily